MMLISTEVTAQYVVIVSGDHQCQAPLDISLAGDATLNVKSASSTDIDMQYDLTVGDKTYSVHGQYIANMSPVSLERTVNDYQGQRAAAAPSISS